ncbi:MAG: hypothetical protein DBP02_01090 [gamma proteobacterium symbiont of Ctena orbiculata]|nr:MAG: hypothetical protein DBP02_01090 [gamma proteobacterium symbiont of Ctena orbiculata]
MSDEQRRVAHFQAQPEGLGLFFHPAALSFAHLARLNLAHSALLGKKTAPAESIGLVLTGPRKDLLSAPGFIGFFWMGISFMQFMAM